jgi:hypothetical protein
VLDSTNVVSAGTLAGVTEATRTSVPVRAEFWFRRGLLVATGLAALAILISTGIAFWAQNEMSPPESVVAAHSLMLAHEGTLYYDLNQYPYTVSAYMPIFYGLEAGLIRLGLPAFAGGRLLSLVAFLGLIAVAKRTVSVYTEDSTYAWIGGILVGISPLLIYWGVVGQVDVVAIFFAVAAFYQFSRHDVLGEPTLVRAGALAALAMFTKQTMIAGPTAMVLVLAMRDWKQAIRFALGLGVPLAAAVLGLNAALDGRFFQDTIFANMNPFSGEKLVAQLQYFGGVCGGLVVIAMAAIPTLRAKALAPGVYLACATFVFLVTAPKVGSDTNYQLELSAILAICAPIGLQRLEFLNLHFAGSKSWITLLILPLGVHAAVGVRSSANIFLARVADEQGFRAEIDGLRPFVPASGGRVISTDFNAMVRLRQRMDVEPLIYGLLVQAGRVDPEPVRRDLARAEFPAVILHQDVFQPPSAANAEIASLPEAQLAELRNHYRLAAHLPGPFLDGVYVYQPLTKERAAQ